MVSPVGNAQALFDNSDALVLRRDTEALLKIGGDAFVLDTRSGHLATAPRAATYWCLRHEQFAEMSGTLDGTQHLEIRFGTVAET
jgi:hypothetical protein